jgi:hypothetical protein
MRAPLRWITAALLAFLAAVPALGETAPSTAAPAPLEDPARLAEKLAPLSTADRAVLLAKLNDTEARDLLLHYLSEANPAAAPPPASVAGRSLATLRASVSAIRENLAAVLAQSGRVGGAVLDRMDARLKLTAGIGSVLVLATVLGLSAAGGLAEAGYRRLTRGAARHLAAMATPTVGGRLARGAASLVYDLVGIAVFGLGFVVAFFAIWRGDDARRDFLIVVLLGILLTRATVALVRFVAQPDHPAWRIPALDDASAAALVRGARWQAILGSAVLIFGLLGQMWEVEHDAWRFGVLLGSVVFALSFSTYLWRSRHAVRPAESDPADWAPSAAAWIWVAGAIGYVIGTLSMGTFALLLGSPFDPLRAAAGFLVLFLAAPYGTRLLTLWFATERLPAPAGPLPITITDPEDGSAMILTSREQPAAAGGTPSAKGPKAEALRRVLKDDRVLGRVIAIAVFLVALSLSALVVGVDLFSEATPYPIARLRAMAETG